MAVETETTNKETEEEDADVQNLKAMGYKQELYRGLAPIMSFAFCFINVNVFTSITNEFNLALQTGGSAVIIWSWVIVSVFTILIGLSLAEICSVYPNAGCVYHWTGQLANAQHAPFISFICGWLNFTGTFISDVALSSSFATVVNTIILVAGGNSLSIGVQTGISIGATLLWTVSNILRIDQQGVVQLLAVGLQISSLVVIVTLLFVFTPTYATAKDVFTSTYNGTGFPFVYVCFIGIIPALYSFAGYEVGGQLAEETHKASRTAPRGIIYTCISSAVVGIIYLLALLFSIPNVATFVENSYLNGTIPNLAIATYQLAVPSPGPLAMSILVIINMYFAGISSITGTSRVCFALARDGLLPFSKMLHWIFKPTKTPVINLIFIFILESLFLLLKLILPTALHSFFTASTFGLQISYTIPILLRCTVARHNFVHGEFNLGRFGPLIATISATWLLLTSVIMIFPLHYPVTAENMNYAALIVGGIILIAIIFWMISARHWFVGPIRAHIDSTPLLPVNVNDKENR